MTTVTHEIDGKVGVVTLAKPPHNLLDDQLINYLVDAYQAVVTGGCRAILLRSGMRHSARAPRWRHGGRARRFTAASSSSKPC
jgi:enoyl-CoA hydratase/carnithine racemase